MSRNPISPTEPLTPREHESLAAMADGLTAKQAAKKMGCSPRTIEAHLYAARAKFGYVPLVRACVMAAKAGIV